ncbi:GerAB/ArcD/ProY family transporter [Paenibacillus sp. LHD-117]|uniref:GerAB/ArcD/ProY family transporter n=1 Tax=Paenibacillus sp. LHD-117 TaxID=3071412 RepID=UPI0027DEF44C|nr:GerAB/ArcD/ProY family transporter [Paenibacillus sp. LHD-117]MDQ6421688.1 GerAB/ArcD/ProY family transporter [Paenibacillus sp. LHD-117]
MASRVKESAMISPVFLWIVLHKSQTGIGVLSFQQNVPGGAEQDAWISLIAVGLLAHVIVWMMFSILGYAENGDLLSLHRQLFGKWIGNTLSLAFYAYAVLAIAVQLRAYVEIIQVWAFPFAYIWGLALVIVLTALYIAGSGFRVVAGACFFGIFIPSTLLLTLYFPLTYAHWENLLPMFDHNLPELAKSARQSLFTFLGAEFMLIYFPYIKNRERSQKWAHIAILHTTIVYLIIELVTFVYFNMDQLEGTVWPTLILSKIIRLPFLERFDYIYVFTWLVVVLPMCSLMIWCGTRILKKTVRLKGSYALWLTGAGAFAGCVALRNPIDIEQAQVFLGEIGLYLFLAYIPLLFVLVSIRRWRGRQANSNESANA